MTNRITREEAIKLAGVETVEAAERSHAVFTGRVTDGTPDHGFTEFSANVSNVTMYVLVETDEVKKAEELDQIDWDSAIEDAEYEVH